MVPVIFLKQTGGCSDFRDGGLDRDIKVLINPVSAGDLLLWFCCRVVSGIVWMQQISGKDFNSFVRIRGLPVVLSGSYRPLPCRKSNTSWRPPLREKMARMPSSRYPNGISINGEAAPSMTKLPARTFPADSLAIWSASIMT